MKYFMAGFMGANLTLVLLYLMVGHAIPLFCHALLTAFCYFITDWDTDTEKEYF